MSEEKQPPTAPPISAPPPYSSLYPTGNSQPEGPQYGFYTPPQPQPGYPDHLYQPGYPSQPFQQPPFQPPNPATQPTVINQPTVVVMGGCPTCRVGILEDDYTCCGLLCAICCFPIGILFCLATKEKRCTNCKSTF